MAESVAREVAKRSVIVRVQGRDSLHQNALGRPSSLSENGITSLGASGIVLDSDGAFVITTCSLFTPFVRRRLEGGLAIISPELKISVLLEDEEWREATVEDVVPSENAWRALNRISEPQSFASRWFIGWPSNPMNPLVTTSAVSNGSENSGFWNAYDFCSFVLLRVQRPSLQKTAETRQPLKIKSLKDVQHGEPVFTVSCPHGLHFPDGLMSYLSRGVVSNVFSVRGDESLLSIDAYCIPGSEGGGVFDSLSGDLLGLIVPPIRRRDGSATMNIVLPLSPILSEISKTVTSLSKPSSAEREVSNVSLSETLKSLVLISLSSTWASGTIISPQGYVLTSGHVFKPIVEDKSSSMHPKLKEGTPPIRIRLHGQMDTWYQATLVFLSQSYIDVAIIKFTPVGPVRHVDFFLKELPDPVTFPDRGAPVFVLGHGLLAPYQRLPPTISKGVISKVLHHNGEPLIYQSDAQVHSGASGGMLIHAETCEFLGVITSNTQSRDGVTFPNLNNSLPAIHIHQSIFRFLGGNNGALVSLNRQDPERDGLWSMKSLIPSQPSVQQIQKPNQPEFGSSQFASFLQKFVENGQGGGSPVQSFKSKL